MNGILTIFGIGVVTILLIVGYYHFSRQLSAKRLSKFQDYLKNNFPDLPENTQLFLANQVSKGSGLDIAIAIDNDQKKIIILLLSNRKFSHNVYPFDDLNSVDSSHQIISRGFLPKTYSYEQTMKLYFKDGSSYSFIAEMVSTKKGDDHGAEVVRKTFAPWEKKLKKIAK